MELLVLSNGHGEDVIAVRILEQLQRLPHAPQLGALPIVGEGHAYTQLAIPIIGPVQSMPSGGFIYMDGQQLLRDVQGGLLQLTLNQYQIVRDWGRRGGKILAVGDIVPLLLAWMSGADYAFVGTAKSEYYLRDETAWLPQVSKLERWSGCVYFPWERWLLSRPRCKAVFPRDALTAETLRQWAIPAFDLGNPMMDSITAMDEPPIPSDTPLKPEGNPSISASPHLPISPSPHLPTLPISLTVLLLPGSRSPEAERNWQVLIEAAAGVISAFNQPSVTFLAAIAPALNLEPFQQHLMAQGWQPGADRHLSVLAETEALAFTQQQATLWLTQHAYRECLLAADVAIAMAGTATEQFVGLGKPAIALPGQGPQFTPIFAKAQARLLGKSLILVEQPAQVASTLETLLRDRDRLERIAENGKRRMGLPGAAERIAHCLLPTLLTS
jgi:uncharacterized protein (TIGR03492 family)